MPSIANVFRRGAVYTWRRRIPAPFSSRLGSHFVLSLRTTNQAVARRVAARLDEEMTRMIEAQQTSGGHHHLTRDQLKRIFNDVGLAHLAKLERVAAYDRLQPTFDIKDSRSTDRVMGHIYRLLATGGPNVEIDAEAVSHLKGAGLSQDEIERVSTYLQILRQNHGHIDHRERLERLLASVGAPPSSINISLAQTTKHRAMAAALLDMSSRWDLGVGNDSVLFGAITRADASQLPTSQSSPIHPSVFQQAETDLRTASQPIRRETASVLDEQLEASIEKSPGMRTGPDGDVVAIAELLLTGSMLNVADKTKRQVRSTAKFLKRYLAEEHQVFDLRDLRQNHIAAFVRFLQTEVYIHHGKSENDETRSIAELRKIWSTKPKDSIGVDKPTADRWANQIMQIFKTARAESVAMDRDLSFKGLIAKTGRPDRARNARPTLQIVQAEALFHQPPFVGCEAWDKLGQPGNLIFHCAMYFAPLLFQYGGERREEVCGALASDVIVDNGPIPYIHICENKFRRIKNPQSRRNMAIHLEIIRLGFLDYVALIKSLGYELLFPDLYSPTSTSPLGDRFHDQLRPILDMAGITAKGTGVHSGRRGFGNNLKQEDVSDEKRAEFLGHGGDSETTERYCDAYKIEIIQREILKLPNVTAHLEAMPITLLPWVAKKQRPPFSHPGRMKAAKDRNRQAINNSFGSRRTHS